VELQTSVLGRQSEVSNKCAVCLEDIVGLPGSLPSGHSGVADKCARGQSGLMSTCDWRMDWAEKQVFLEDRVGLLASRHREQRKVKCHHGVKSQNA
jgi:hypothetical protein